MTDLQQVLDATVRDHGPGLVGLVTENGETVFEGTAGIGDLATGRPIAVTDQFRIGSITKTYTAAVVLQLASEGVLAVDDPLSRWLPGLIPDDDGITVEVLLRMRSGLPNYVDVVYGDPPDLAGALSRYWSPEELVAASLRGTGRVAPDLAHRYSNTDYVLLGLVVEAATGQRVDAQFWQRIVAPLGLPDTTFPIADRRLRGPHARGHVLLPGATELEEFTQLSPSEAWTAGAIVATAHDVAAFFDGLLDGTLLDAEGLARLTDCTEVVADRRRRGMGVVRYDFGPSPAYGHTGGVPGFSCVAMRTESGRAVVLWQNGIDPLHMLESDNPFVLAALAE